MATLEDVIVYAAYTGIKKGIEKLTKGNVSSDDIDNRVEKRMNRFQKKPRQTA